MKRTFVDSGVLIAAARGTDEVARRAMEVLDDPERSFVSSSLVRLEVLPKALFHRKQAEAEFYQAFFAGVETWVQAAEPLFTEALEEAARSGLSALDSLHVASAARAQADELVTTERAGKPLHRVSAVAVRTIHS